MGGALHCCTNRTDTRHATVNFVAVVCKCHRELALPYLSEPVTRREAVFNSQCSDRESLDDKSIYL